MLYNISMKKILLFVLSLALLFGTIGTVEAAVRVRGYYRNNGTYVQPYYRTTPNSYKFDNYSTRGNYNPHTRKRGYTNPWR